MNPARKIGDVEVAGMVNRDAIRIAEARTGSGTSVPCQRTARGGASTARHGADGSVAAGDLADALVVLVGDIEIARSVQSHPEWLVELRAGGGPAIAAEAAGECSRYGACARNR